MRDLKATASSQIRAYNDIIRYRTYFGDVDAGVTSVLAAGETRLFEVGRGQTTSNITTGADVTLKDCDVSLFGNKGTIPNSENFMVLGIGIDIHLASVQATTPYTDNGVTSVDGAPLQVVNPYPLVEHIRSQCTFQLWRNSAELLEEGNVADYPAGLWNAGWGSDGANAGHADGAAVPATKGFIIAQNGSAFRPLTVAQRLAALDDFYGILEVCRPMTLTGTKWCGYIDFLLVGQANVSRQSGQYEALNIV